MPVSNFATKYKTADSILELEWTTKPFILLLSPLYSLRWLCRWFLMLEEYWEVEVEEEVCDLVAADASCGGCGWWCHAGAMEDESW